MSDYIGYFKGELRACECENGFRIGVQKERHASDYTEWWVECGCGRRGVSASREAEAIANYNHRPTFDKAIDALIRFGESLEYEANPKFLYGEICDLTGLTEEEALEIYHERREGK